MVDDNSEDDSLTVDVEPEKAQPTREPASEMIGRANAAAERLEKANVELRNLILRQESLRVEETLGGKASVSIPKKDDSPEDYVKKVMANDFK